MLMLQVRLGITRGKARLLMALWRTRTGVSDGTLADYGRGYGEGSTQSVKVQVCSLRKRLVKGAIETIWGYGYQLSAGGRKQIDEILGPSISVNTVNAINDDAETPLPLAVAILCGRLADKLGPEETSRILETISKGLRQQYSHA